MGERVMSDSALQCPQCKCDYINLLYVNTYSRHQGSNVGINVSVCMALQEAVTRNTLQSNPSPRLGGVKMTMQCADCSHIFEMSYYQHKGQILSSMYDEMRLYRVLEKDDTTIKTQKID